MSLALRDAIGRELPQQSSAFVLTDAEAAALGYIVPTLPPYNADNTGATDALAALRAARDDAHDEQRPVWLSSGTYAVSDCFGLFEWATSASGNAETNGHQWFGASYPSRPEVRPLASSTKFNNPLAPRPVVAYAKWRPRTGTLSVPNGAVTDTPTTANHIPSSPFIETGSYHPTTGEWEQATSVLFFSGWFNINIHCGNKAGAVGLSMATAQGCYLGNIDIDATGAYKGIQGLPGRSSNCMNITVRGGTAGGVSTVAEYGSIGSTAGCEVAGLYLLDQVGPSLDVGDFVPLCVTGYHIRRASGSAWTVRQSSQTSANGATLIDGIIEITSGTANAIDNTNAQGIYLRNTYWKGTPNLIKSAGNTPISATGEWKRIEEYSGNVMAGTFVGSGVASNGSSSLQHFTYIDGVTTRVQEVFTTPVSNSTAPPSDLITKHIATIPMPDDGPFINITDAPYNCTSGGADCLAGFHAAVADADADGHHRVLVPFGSFHMSSTALTNADTLLMGISTQSSQIRPRSSWVPADNTSPYIMQTANSGSGTGKYSFLSIFMPGTQGDMGRWSHLNWRLGRRSVTFNVNYDRAGVGGTAASENLPWGRTVFHMTNNGGGRHYGHYTKGDGNNGANFRAIKVQNNAAQPWAFYGYNCEAGGAFGEGSSEIPESAYPTSNMEVIGSANGRVYSCKREGQSPTITIRDSTNIGVFSGGGMREGSIGPDLTPSFVSRFHEVYGSSTGIVMANIFVQNFGPGTTTLVDYTMYDDIAGGGIRWPNGVALYKRGYPDYNDAAVVFN